MGTEGVDLPVVVRHSVWVARVTGCHRWAPVGVRGATIDVVVSYVGASWPAPIRAGPVT